MMKVLKFIAVLALVLFTSIAYAQNLNGTWIGSYVNVPADMMKPQKVLIEIQVYNDSLITGASHLYYTRGRFEHHKINGKFNRQNNTVILSEDSIIGVKVGALVSIREGVYTLNLTSSGNRHTLEGRWRDKKKIMFTRLQVEVHLLKKIETEEVITATQANTLPPVLSRASDIQHLFEIKETDGDSVNVQIVDNGTIDGDTVSVYLDNRELIKSIGLTEKAVSFSFTLDRSQPIQKLKMVAENMGSIPPNTALFIITVGGNRHNIYLSSDMNKNAVVEFFLKK